MHFHWHLFEHLICMREFVHLVISLCLSDSSRWFCCFFFSFMKIGVTKQRKANYSRLGCLFLTLLLSLVSLLSDTAIKPETQNENIINTQQYDLATLLKSLLLRLHRIFCFVYQIDKCPSFTYQFNYLIHEHAVHSNALNSRAFLYSHIMNTLASNQVWKLPNHGDWLAVCSRYVQWFRPSLPYPYYCY